MATIYKRGNRWYLNWREGGRQYRRSLGSVSRAEAERARKVKEAELATGISLFSTAPNFGDYALEYLEWYKYEYPSSYPRIEQIVRVHLIPAFGPYALDQMEPLMVEQYKARRLQTRRKLGKRIVPVKAETVAKEIRTVKAMLNRAVDWGIIERHPFPRVKPPQNTDSKPPRFYTQEELQAIYEASSPVERWIWQLMANTGLRRGEALMLKTEWDLGNRLWILSEGEARTKSGKWREVPIGPGSREALDNLPPDENGYVLPRMTPRSLTRAFERCLKRAGLDGSLHCLRHTFCSHLVMKGVPLRTVQILAGHSSFAVTERYAHLAPDHLAGAIAGLHL